MSPMRCPVSCASTSATWNRQSTWRDTVRSARYSCWTRTTRVGFFSLGVFRPIGGFESRRSIPNPDPLRFDPLLDCERVRERRCQLGDFTALGYPEWPASTSGGRFPRRPGLPPFRLRQHLSSRSKVLCRGAKALRADGCKSHLPHESRDPLGHHPSRESPSESGGGMDCAGDRGRDQVGRDAHRQPRHPADSRGWVHGRVGKSRCHQANVVYHRIDQDGEPGSSES